MFRETRRRLTILYTVVMAVFLAFYIIVSDAGILWVLHNEEKQGVLSFAEEEIRENIPRLKNNQYSAEQKAANSELAGEKIFSYVFDTSGQLVDIQEPAARMRSEVEAIISSWQGADREVLIKKIRLSGGERAVVIMCSMSIKDQEDIVGRIYVGEDITQFYGLLKSLLLFLIAVSFVFLIIAAFVGYMLTGRTIIPIKQSFMRQRQFTADASHELRTPLSILLTSVEAVEGDEANKLSPFSLQVLDDMKSEVKRMTKIVADLLTLARADAGKTNIIKDNFALYMVAEQVVRSFQPAADEKGIELALTGKSGSDIFADKERINQLLLILIDNAIKYTPDGGSVHVAIGMIEGTKVSLIVDDSGIGIPDSCKTLIFDRFYRADKARSREQGGTGLGLSIAKWIVDAHDGIIRVENSPSGGSRFIVEIPTR